MIRVKTFEEIKKIIEDFCRTYSLDVAYQEFDDNEFVTDKYMVWREKQVINHKADNKVYASITEYEIILHIGSTDKDLEYALEDYLNDLGYVWSKEAPVYVEKEQMYEIVFTI